MRFEVPSEIFGETHLKTTTTSQKFGPTLLAALSKPKPDVWYFIQPVSINKMDDFMKKIAAMGGLDITKKYSTNHAQCSKNDR